MFEQDYQSQVAAKMAAQVLGKQIADRQNGAGPLSPIGYAPDTCLVRPTLREEAEKSSAHHFEQAQKAASAADFLRSHPEFDEFIRLIRTGAIQI